MACTLKDCLSAPIKTECFYFCIFQILAIATPEDKRKVLKINASTAERIFFVFNNYSPTNYDDLSKHLEQFQNEEVIQVFRNITQSQLNHFSR